MACTDIYSRICVVFLSLGSSLAVTFENKYVKVEVLFSSYETFFLRGVTETPEETVMLTYFTFFFIPWSSLFSTSETFLFLERKE